METVHFIQQEARKQGKRVYRVDIDFKSAFNAMSQAALLQVMRKFKSPDVDLLEQMYEGATLRLAPNNKKSATITFNTDVAQGSITSPQLFNIVINALLRMLTVTGQNEDISHGLQISNDQKGDNKRDENIYTFHSISGDTTGNEDMCNVERRAKSLSVNSGSARTVTETATAYATVLRTSGLARTQAAVG